MNKSHLLTKDSNASADAIDNPDKPPATLDALASLIKNDKDRTRLIEAVKNNKPEHWSGRSNAPYYKREYAEVTKAILTKMMHSRNDQMFYYKDFPYLRPTSIYQRLMQSVKYLLDYLDPDDTYKKFWSTCSTQKERVGLRIFIRQDLLSEISANDFMPTELSTDPATWKTRLYTFLENATDGDDLKIENIYISEEVREDLELQLSTIPDLSYVIGTDYVKLVKIKQ